MLQASQNLKGSGECLPKLTYIVLVRSQFLAGSSLEASTSHKLPGCPEDSHLSSPRVTDPRERRHVVNKSMKDES